MANDDLQPLELPLNNTMNIRFDGTRVNRVINEGLSLRGYYSATRAGGPLDSTCVAAAVAVGDGTGDYIAPIVGSVALAALTPWLHKRVWVVGESVPAGSYREAFAVTVVEDQGGS